MLVHFCYSVCLRKDGISPFPLSFSELRLGKEVSERSYLPERDSVSEHNAGDKKQQLLYKLDEYFTKEREQHVSTSVQVVLMANASYGYICNSNFRCCVKD